jgi:glycosyltransferase involved in cell wall biosynthesis
MPRQKRSASSLTKTDEMRLGVIIPLHNRETMIGSALRSVLRERDAVALDIVVIDDGSTDGSAEVVRQWAAQASSIRLVSQDNMGVACARNAGLDHLGDDTDLVTFLDSDDVCAAGRFNAELGRFSEDPGLDLTYGLMTLVDRIDDDTLAPAEGCQAVTVRGLALSSGIFRREWFSRLGGFDVQFDVAEDADFLFRLFEQSPRYVLTDTVATFHRRHRGNMSNDKISIRRGLMLAIHKSVNRRRQNPALSSMEDIFEMNALLGTKGL